jgi:hypothetical protein
MEEPISLRERIERYVDACPPAISGQRGHDQTFRVACILVQGFDLSPEDAFFFLARYNQRCEPPWAERELWHKLRDADRVPERKPRGYLLYGGAKLHEPVSCPPVRKNSFEPVPAVPATAVTDAFRRVSFPKSPSLNRQLAEREISILRQASAEHDPIILTALSLFNATVADYTIYGNTTNS